MEQRAAVLNISPRDDVSMVSSSSDREAPFRRSPHHLLQVEQQEELLRKWQKQKQYQSQLKEQMSERQAQRDRQLRADRELQHRERREEDAAKAEAAAARQQRGGVVQEADMGRLRASPKRPVPGPPTEPGTPSQYAAWQGQGRSPRDGGSPQRRPREDSRDEELERQRAEHQRQRATQQEQEKMVAHTSQQIEVMKSEVDRMLQAARAEASDKTHSEIEEVTREVRSAAERAIRDAVEQARSSPPRSPSRPSSPGILQEAEAELSRLRPSGDGDISGVSDLAPRGGSPSPDRSRTPVKEPRSTSPVRPLDKPIDCTNTIRMFKVSSDRPLCVCRSLARCHCRTASLEFRGGAARSATAGCRPRRRTR